MTDLQMHVLDKPGGEREAVIGYHVESRKTLPHAEFLVGDSMDWIREQMVSEVQEKAISDLNLKKVIETEFLTRVRKAIFAEMMTTEHVKPLQRLLEELKTWE